MGSATQVAAVRRPRLDRARVVEAARDLLDEQGIEAFSMSRLGERLGVTAMALYRHVADRADLEAAVVDLVLLDLEQPSPGGELGRGRRDVDAARARPLAAAPLARPIDR